MSTTEDFENAPVGATATNWDGSVRVWKETETGMYPWWAPFNYEWLSNGELVGRGFTLNLAAPTTAREALELVWELAHPMKEGHEVPTGTECISKVADGEFITYRSLKPFDGVKRPGWAEARTLDPLPEPEPDWLNAPAVIATTAGDDNHRTFANVGDRRWQAPGEKSHPWTDLEDVTPLYPKEDA